MSCSDSASSAMLISPTTMPGEEKAMQLTRQRKKGKKSRPKGKNQSSRPGASVDGQGDLLGPPLFEPAFKKVVEEKRKEVRDEEEEKEESSVVICLQVLLPYLLAGMGMVMAGMVLDYVQVSPSIRLCASRVLTDFCRSIFSTSRAKTVCIEQWDFF